MKFSDMMGKRGRDTEVTEPELPPEARTAPPVPEAPIRFGGNRSELEDAAAAFGGGTITPAPAAPAPANPAVAAPPPLAPEATAPAAPAPTSPPVPEATASAPAVSAPPPLPAAPEVAASAPPSISEVVAELGPRPAAAAAVTDQQLDASAWLDGINSIDDDLLPR